MKYTPTIGLEIHAELKTRTKMFCDSLNDPDETRPNHNVCPVCLGHPGTLPTINRSAVEHVIKMGLAVGGTVAPTTKFDRKNYFYPDLPKGYQISQYDVPLVSDGKLLGVRVRRIHLEEDTGTLVHGEQQTSFVDFNRAGVPLMELVTEPDISSAEDAVAFAKEVQLILRYLGISDANMEKGEMRIEANISVREGEGGFAPEDESSLGTKVEVKNINSFKAVEGAIAYEVGRQTELLESGKEVLQETRGWDEEKKATFSQRSKEEAHDYRYFPEPDLPPFTTDIFSPEALFGMLPELPEAKRNRFQEEFGLSQEQAALLVEDPEFARFFEEATSELDTETVKRGGHELLFNYLTSDLRGYMNEKGKTLAELRVSPENFADLVALLLGNEITSRQAKEILPIVCETDSDPREVMAQEGLGTISDVSVVEDAVRSVMEKNESAVQDYLDGKENALQFLIGQAMGKLRGRAEPDLLKALFLKKLKER